MLIGTACCEVSDILSYILPAAACKISLLTIYLKCDDDLILNYIDLVAKTCFAGYPHMFGMCPPVCLETPYVWMPPYVWTTSYVWMPP